MVTGQIVPSSIRWYLSNSHYLKSDYLNSGYLNDDHLNSSFLDNPAEPLALARRWDMQTDLRTAKIVCRVSYYKQGGLIEAYELVMNGVKI